VSDKVAALTEATFDEAVGSSQLPVLVEFWTEWCPPCKALAPVLDAVASERHDQLRVYRVNSDDHPALAARFGVMSVPTLLVFDAGRIVKRMIGARGKNHLVQELAEVVDDRQVTTSSAVQSDGSPS
jgi:thioredoxin 1